MKRLLIAAMAAITALAFAGCRGDSDKGDGVATAGGTPTASTTGSNGNSGDTAEQMRRFASCMREQGIDMPDPEVDSEGRVRMQVGTGGQQEGGGGTPPDRGKFEAAQKACQQYLPNGGEPPKLDPEQVEQARQFAKCMRENGVPAFPDPQPDGGMQIQIGPDTGIDPNSQAFKDAQTKCEQYMPRGPESGGVRGGGS